MSLAAATGRVPQLVGEPVGLRAVPDERCLLIGARDLDPAEGDALAVSRVKRVAAEPDALRAALQKQSPMDVYLHLDVDIVDGSDLPGLRFPAPDGPTFSVVEDCLAQIVDCTHSGGRVYLLRVGIGTDRGPIDSARHPPARRRDRSRRAVAAPSRGLTTQGHVGGT